MGFWAEIPSVASFLVPTEHLIQTDGAILQNKKLSLTDMQLLCLFKTARNVIYTKFAAQSYQLLKPLPAFSFHIFCFFFFFLLFVFFFFFSGQALVLEIPQIVIILLVLHYLALFIY